MLIHYYFVDIIDILGGGADVIGVRIHREFLDVVSDGLGARARELTQELYSLVGLAQLLSEHLNLGFQHLNHPALGVVIAHWLVRDKGSFRRILERVQVFVNVGVTGIQAGNHQTKTVSS